MTFLREPLQGERLGVLKYTSELTSRGINPLGPAELDKLQQQILEMWQMVGADNQPLDVVKAKLAITVYAAKL